jgi:boron transporter
MDPSETETKAPGEKKGPASQRGTTRRGSNRDGASRRTTADRWWKIHLFRGMVNDLRRRAPYYWSDWVDAWDYRVVPATVYMYFAK